MTNKNINIIELIIAILILLYYKIKKAAAILSVYYGIKYIINLIITSVKLILRENTIIGQIIVNICAFYSKYSHKIRSFILYYNVSSAIIICIFRKYLSPFISTLLGVVRNINTYYTIFSFVIFILTCIKKLINIYNY